MVSLSNHVAISMRLNTRRQTAVAMATRLPRYARNDRLKRVRARSCARLTPDVLRVTLWARQRRNCLTIDSQAPGAKKSLSGLIGKAV